jgi:hypothetical protein
VKKTGFVAIKKISPLIFTILVLWGVFLILLFPSLKNNQGQLIYSLDDTYIHMAIAKNFSQYGVWGVTRHDFTSSSSSLLWSLLLSGCFFIFGVSETIPLALNLIIATLLLGIIFYWVDKMGYQIFQTGLILLAFVFFIPLHYLIFIGLEHTLQIFLDFLFMIFAARVFLEGSIKKRAEEILGLGILAMLVVMVRFEGLFLVFIISALLLISKKIFCSVWCLVCGFFPVLIYGLISISKGWFFLPSSVLLKGTRPDITTVGGWLHFFYLGIRQMVYNIHLLVLILLLLVLLVLWNRKYNHLKGRAPFLGITVIAVTILHMFFARSGFYLNYYFQIRYDAYLLGLGLFSIFALLARLKDQHRMYGFFPKILKIFLVVILISPLAERGIRTVAKINPAAHNTYVYQYQMGRFLRQHYQGKKIVLNDIGAPNYFADIECLDIMALGSKAVGDLILKDQYSSQAIFRLAADFGASIAIINDVLLQSVGGVPAQWFRVGQWKVSDSVISNLNVISFYALEKSEIPELYNNLKTFSAHLPNGVEQIIVVPEAVGKVK